MESGLTGGINDTGSWRTSDAQGAWLMNPVIVSMVITISESDYPFMVISQNLQVIYQILISNIIVIR